MQQDPDPMPQAATPSAAGPGAALLAAREAAGLSRSQVARALNLEQSVVVALETDDVERLPEPAYVKGYLRAYARLLDLDAGALLEAYEGLGVPAPEVAPHESAAAFGEQQRVRAQVIGGVVALVLVVLSAWWFTRPKPTPPVPPPRAELGAQQALPGASATAPVAAAVVPSRAPSSTQATDAQAAAATQSAAPAVDVPAASSPQSAAPAAAKTTVATATASKAAPPASPAPSTPPPRSAPVAANGATLTLQLTAKSWVQIDDHSGKHLLRGLLRAGTTHSLTGEPPFSVFLGYAPGVALRVDGHAVAIEQYKRGNNTARFTLQADGQTQR